MSEKPKTFLLQCVSCKKTMTVFEQVLGNKIMCSDCGFPVDVSLYPDLCKFIKEQEWIKIETQKNEERILKEKRAQEEQELQLKQQWEKEQWEKERQQELQKWKEEENRKYKEAEEKNICNKKIELLYQAKGVFQSIPEYETLKTMTGVYKIIAFLEFALAVFVGLVGLVLTMGMDNLTMGMDKTGVVGMCFTTSLTLIITGLGFLVTSQLMAAFRDMSINSWKQLILIQNIEEKIASKPENHDTKLNTENKPLFLTE